MAKVNHKIKKTPNDKQKPLRMSTRLQERVAQQSVADNLPAVSQPVQSEPLDVVPTTSTVYNIKEQLKISDKGNHNSERACLIKQGGMFSGVLIILSFR